MSDLASLIFEPVPLPWAQLLARLPRAIELPDPEDDPDDDEVLFKRIDLITRNELELHLAARTSALLLEIQELQLLGELFARARAAGCGPDDILFAAIEGQGVRS